MRALFSDKFTACATVEVLAEYQTALRSKSVGAFARSRGLDLSLITVYAQAVAEKMELVAPGPRFRCSDSDDERYTEASTGARASHIVSTDEALLEHQTVLEASVVTPEQFVRVLTT